MSRASHIQPTRRIVTGHDAQGRSVILSDGVSPTLIESENAPGFAMAELWRCDSQPPSNEGNADGALLDFAMEPKHGGLIARVVQFPPDEELDWSTDRATRAFDEFGGANAMLNDGARHAAFHRTQSLDFAIVMDGEIWAMLDVGETLMKPGDVLVQRGTSHAWANRSDKPARVCFVAVTAQPLQFDGRAAT